MPEFLHLESRENNVSIYSPNILFYLKVTLQLLVKDY